MKGGAGPDSCKSDSCLGVGGGLIRFVEDPDHIPRVTTPVMMVGAAAQLVSPHDLNEGQRHLLIRETRLENCKSELDK